MSATDDHHLPATTFIPCADFLGIVREPTSISPYNTGRALPCATMLSSDEKYVFCLPLSVCLDGDFCLRRQHLRHTAQHHRCPHRKQDRGCRNSTGR
jgi:hypothetical protein